MSGSTKTCYMYRRAFGTYTLTLATYQGHVPTIKNKPSTLLFGF